MGSSESNRKHHYAKQPQNHRIRKDTVGVIYSRPLTPVHALHFENDLDGSSSFIFCTLKCTVQHTYTHSDDCEVEG